MLDMMHWGFVGNMGSHIGIIFPNSRLRTRKFRVWRYDGKHGSTCRTSVEDARQARDELFLQDPMYGAIA